MSEQHKQQDLYKIMGVKKDCSVDDIRKAFMKQALTCHPDKAPEGKNEEETAAIKKRYELQYIDLQKAYKILMNPKAREQYDQTQQNTFVDLRDKDKRDVGYKKSKAFTTTNEDGERVFDNEKFSEAFNKSRSVKDASGIEKLQREYNKAGKVTVSEIDDLMARRKKELDDMKIDRTLKGDGSNFDINTFNKMFDHMKKTNPTATGVQLYGEEPAGLFSGSKGLVEDSDLGGMTMNYGLAFGNSAGVDSLVSGATYNPASTIDVSQFKHNDESGNDYVTGSGIGHADANYNTVAKASHAELKARIEAIEKERERLKNMDEGDFIVTQTEIEKQYSELFETNEKAMVEGIAAKQKKKSTKH